MQLGKVQEPHAGAAGQLRRCRDGQWRLRSTTRGAAHQQRSAPCPVIRGIRDSAATAAATDVEQQKTAAGEAADAERVGGSRAAACGASSDDGPQTSAAEAGVPQLQPAPLWDVPWDEWCASCRHMCQCSHARLTKRPQCCPCLRQHVSVAASTSPGRTCHSDFVKPIFIMCRRHTAGVMVQLWALMLPLGFGGVAIIGQLQGLTAATMGPTDRARRQSRPLTHVSEISLNAYMPQGRGSEHQTPARLELLRLGSDA